MAYDRRLAQRIRDELAGRRGIDVREVSMFGGRSFMVDDALAVSASNQGDLLVRCSADGVDELLQRPGATWPEMRGRRMSAGWIRVAVEQLDDASLTFWVDEALRVR